MIFLLLFASLVRFSRMRLPSRLSLDDEGVDLPIAQRNAGDEKAVPAKCRTAFQEMLNRDAGDLEDLAADPAELTGYRSITDAGQAHRSTVSSP
jgi:hypothetical protein